MVDKAKTIPTIAAEIDMTDFADPSLTLTFSDGETLKFKPSMTTLDVRMRATMHGFKQKLVDAAAIARNQDTGRSATLADKKAAVGEVYARLLAGEWNKVREGASATGGLLFRAVCELYPAKTPDVLRIWLVGKTDDEKAALRLNPKIAAIITRMKAEQAKDAPDTDAMLGELEGME